MASERYIQFTGNNVPDLKDALDALKPASEILPKPISPDGWIAFDQVWPDGQLTSDRWRIQIGQWFDSQTGLVSNVRPQE